MKHAVAMRAVGELPSVGCSADVAVEAVVSGRVGPHVEAKPEARSSSDLETKAAPEPDAKAEPEAEPEPETQTEPVSEAKAEPKAEAKA